MIAESEVTTANSRKDKPTPPFVSGKKPLVGHALAFQKERTSLFKRGYAEHGALFAIRLGNQNAAVLVGPAYQKIFFSETDKSLNIQKPYKFLQAMFGNTLFLAPHDTYLKHRPIVQEMFRRQKMVDYLAIMQVQVQRWLDSWGDSGEIEITTAMHQLVKDVAGYCFLGADIHERIGREFWTLYDDLSAALDPLLPPNLPLPKFWRRDRARAKMESILGPVIRERRQYPDRYDDFFQHIINKAEAVDDELEDEVIFNLMIGLMFAGHETTSGQGAWAVIQLLQHPNYLQLVQAEVDEYTTVGQPFDHRALAKMTHLAWAVRETERMRPSADLVMRVVDEGIDVGPYYIPEGWLVQVAAEVAHFLPELWHNPYQYDPLRYAPERAEDKQQRFSLIGFGGGMHKCTGMNFANMEMSVIISLMLQQFEVELVTESPQIDRGLGANRPTKTILRYRRK